MRTLVRLFPRRFRERYGAELVELVDATGGGWRDGVDLLRTALSLHVDNGLRALGRWVRARRKLLLSIALAAAAGALLGGSARWAEDLAIAGCSVLGGAAASGACVLAFVERHHVGRALVRGVGP